MTLVVNKGQKNISDVRGERIGFGTVGTDHVVPSGLMQGSVNGVYSVFDPRITYSSGWTVAAGTVADDFRGLAVQANLAGNALDLTFNGTSIAIIGGTFASGGKADIYIDGILQEGRVNISTFLSGYYGLTGLNATDSTINVVDTSAFAASGTILIDNEIITYSGKTGTTFTGCTRSGTESHITSAMVYQYDSVVDFYTAYKESRIVVWSNTQLQPGRHTLRVQVRPDSNPSSGFYPDPGFVYINGFIAGGVLGAENVITNVSHITFTGVAINASGFSSSISYGLQPSSTSQQVVNILGTGAFDGGGVFVPCFYSLDPRTNILTFYCPTAASSTVDVVVTITSIGAGI